MKHKKVSWTAPKQLKLVKEDGKRELVVEEVDTTDKFDIRYEDDSQFTPDLDR